MVQADCRCHHSCCKSTRWLSRRYQEWQNQEGQWIQHRSPITQIFLDDELALAVRASTGSGRVASLTLAGSTSSPRTGREFGYDRLPCRTWTSCRIRLRDQTEDIPLSIHRVGTGSMRLTFLG